MIKRFFSPKPFSIFLLLTTVLVYGINHYLPNSYIISKTKLDLSSDPKKSPPLIVSSKIENLAVQLKEVLKKEKLPPSSIISFLENHPSTTNLYPSKISVQVSKDSKEVSLDISYTPKLYNKETAITVIEEMKTLLAEYIRGILQTQKNNTEIVLNEKRKNIIPLKKVETPELVEPEKIIIKVPFQNHKVPAEIIGDFSKFKEFKAQEEIKLKEIQDLINSLPEPKSTPLVMLSSNLQKNYEMQLIVLNGKKDWIKNTDAEQVKKIEVDKAVVSEKLKFETIKLRDESYYFKGQQDKALREKHRHLLHEEKSKKEVLEALNELERSLLQKDNNPDSMALIYLENEIKAKKEMEEIEAQRIKTLEMGIMELLAKLAEIDAQLENLKNNGISSSIPIETVVKVNYYSNSLIAFNLGVILLTLLLLTGIIFGSSNKVNSAKVVADIFGAPLLGTIPNLPNEGLENAKHKKLTDAIDLITESLSKTMQTKEIKTLNILSPNNSDGRTQLTGMLTLSFNLKKNMKVIALDTCFNNPKLAEFLELKTKMQPSEEGLIDYFKHLVETKEISEADNNQWLAKLVKPCIRNGVFVISPGNGSFSDSNTFNSRVIMTMYEGLGKYVDLIIADTPPLDSNLSFVSKVLAENSSGNILLIKKGIYKKKDLENIKRKLIGVNLLGFIFK